MANGIASPTETCSVLGKRVSQPVAPSSRTSVKSALTLSQKTAESKLRVHRAFRNSLHASGSRFSIIQRRTKYSPSMSGRKAWTMLPRQRPSRSNRLVTERKPCPLARWVSPFHSGYSLSISSVSTSCNTVAARSTHITSHSSCSVTPDTALEIRSRMYRSSLSSTSPRRASRFQVCGSWPMSQESVRKRANNGRRSSGSTRFRASSSFFPEFPSQARV